jgi:hypothetical protein
VINRLLLNPQKQAAVSETSEGVSRTFGKDKSPRDFGTLLRQKLETFRQQTLPAAEAIIAGNLAFYLGKLTAADNPLKDWLDEFLNDSLARLPYKPALKHARRTACSWVAPPYGFYAISIRKPASHAGGLGFESLSRRPLESMRMRRAGLALYPRRRSSHRSHPGTACRRWPPQSGLCAALSLP